MYVRSRNLFDCHIAGFAYYDGLDVINELQLGTSVSLVSDSENPHDPDAVAIYFGETKLGYIPKAKTFYVSKHLYFGHDNIFEVKINYRNLEEHPERQFRIVVRVNDNRKRGSFDV
ncbi:MAG: HIRAN domain-containing protein [Oscillospiraceae bacterium]|nr:HIRAN domain-containing protein [Oscillospiraceae bacterium]